jgi:predicted TIM-barrel fold metal-dependent hydrolase
MKEMAMLFEVKEIDKKFYRERVRDFLPGKIIDIHTHIWLDCMVSDFAKKQPDIAMWPFRIARDNSIEDLIETYRLLFPDKSVTPLIFSNILDKNNLDQMNEYTTQCAGKYNLPAFAVIRPDWNPGKLEAVINKNGFLGVKPYLTFAPDNIPTDKIEILDFLPHNQLKLLNKYRRIVMLHIPRNKRLKDPVNLKQMLEIERSYPNVKLIIAHVGRAYCLEDAGTAFEVLKNTKNMLFDISANTNADVFKHLINAVGPKRILFGSDMPITRMRMRRVCENGSYVNLVPTGLYGDVSDDKHMREVESAEAEKLTFFIYEEIEAFRKAAATARLNHNDIEDVFYNNAKKLLRSVKQANNNH